MPVVETRLAGGGSSERDAAHILRDLYDDVIRFASGTSQDDDPTAIVIKRTAERVPGATMTESSTPFAVG